MSANTEMIKIPFTQIEVPQTVVAAVALAGVGLYFYRAKTTALKNPDHGAAFEHKALTNSPNNRKTFAAPSSPSAVGLQPFVRAKIVSENRAATERRRQSGSGQSTPFAQKFKLKNKSIGLLVDVDIPVKFDRKLRDFGFRNGIEEFDYHSGVKLTNLFMRNESLFDKKVAGLGLGAEFGVKQLITPLSAQQRGAFQTKLAEQGFQVKALPTNFAPIDAENYIIYNPDDSLDDCYSKIIADGSSEDDVARSLAIVDQFYEYDPQCKDPKKAICSPILRMTGGRLLKPDAFNKISTKTRSDSVSGGGDKYSTKKGEGIPEGMKQAFRLAGVYTIRTRIYIIEKTVDLWEDIRKVSTDEVSDPLALTLSAIYWTVMAFCPALAAVEWLALKGLKNYVTFLKATYNFTCAGNKTSRKRGDKIKDFANVDRSSAMDFVCQRCMLPKAQEGKWINKGYRPYFIADPGLRNIVSWWIYNPGWDYGDAKDIKALLARRTKYSGEKGPAT